LNESIKCKIYNKIIIYYEMHLCGRMEICVIASKILVILTPDENAMFQVSSALRYGYGNVKQNQTTRVEGGEEERYLFSSKPV
jgi:hypothetical protein